MNVTKLPFDPGPAAWNSILPAAQQYPELSGSRTADFLIIGAGFAGLSAARRLQQLEPNANIVLLEARRIAEGPAGRNSGFMIDLPHNLASTDYAGQAASDHVQTELNREAISFAQEAANDYSMSGEAFVISGKTNAAATEKGTVHNKTYAAHLAKLGEAHELLDAQSMQQICGSSYYQSGLFTPGTAMLQPALYTRKFAAGVAQQGVKIFENSPVTGLEQQDGNWHATTPNGNLSAGKVILAVNGHAESFGFFKRRLIHIYLYASMTKPLSANEIAKLGGQRRWAFTPADPMGTTVRRVSGIGGDRIIVRNRFTWSPGRTVSETKLNSIGKVHDRSFANRFPQLGTTQMEHRWGGLLCLSWNTVPAFGELKPNLYSACCQNGLGTAMGTLAGKLAAEQTCGIEGKSLNAMRSFDEPKRLPPEPFSTIGANATMRWGEFKAGKEL